MPTNHLVSSELEQWKISLLQWFARVQRPMPWRIERSPYRTLVSEMMLQQTQVKTVIPYFEKWVARWPDVESLASADEAEVLAMWSGLGYYRRARNLHACAKFVAEFGWPDSAEELQKKLKGVGSYTAGAIASIGFGLDAALVDGNVERVYSRFNNDDSVGAKLNKNAWDWAKDSLPTGQSAMWNQGLMELGSLICTPRNPKCTDCPISSNCKSLEGNTVDIRPVIVPKAAFNLVHHLVIIPVFQERVGLETIPAGQWWEGMLQFPRRENSLESLENLTKWLNPISIQKLGQMKHTVTNNKITVEVYQAEISEAIDELQWHEREAIDSLPTPAPIKKINKMRA